MALNCDVQRMRRDFRCSEALHLSSLITSVPPQNKVIFCSVGVALFWRRLLRGSIFLLLCVLAGFGSRLIARGFRSRLYLGLGFRERSLKPEILFHIGREAAPKLSIQFLWRPREAERGCKASVLVFLLSRRNEIKRGLSFDSCERTVIITVRSPSRGMSSTNTLPSYVFERHWWCTGVISAEPA